ncbi:MAG: PEP-CTERM sorting domain-containing protein [Gemmataceae bacterium]|nr:PEP-CTERM sorting domain-containing protein [Gemmataceae bacterium]
MARSFTTPLRRAASRGGFRLLAAGLLCLLVAGPAGATIIGGAVTGGTAFGQGGVFVKLTPPLMNPFGPPNSVGNDTFQSPNLFGFDEDQNIFLAAPLATDVGLNPIPAGMTVASHYIFFDPERGTSIVGTVDFDSDVVAIITSRGNLIASDFLANTGVNYLSPGARGLEAGDSVTISGPRQILFDTRASSPGDYVRVLTEFSPGAVVPEPASLVLAGAGAAALAGYARRRRAVAG